MSAKLLHKMLGEIEKHSQSPLVAQRQLWRIARGHRDDPRDTTHALFDWFCEFSKTGLSEEDQALVDANPDDIEDEVERKKLIRRQAKALKRAQAKNRSFTSKATPELVTYVTEMLEGDDHVGIADKLFYAAACAPLLTPTQLIELLETIKPTVASCSPSGSLSAVQDSVAGVIALGVFGGPTEAATGLWWLAHAPLPEGKALMMGELIKAARKGRPAKEYKDLFPDYVSNVGKALKSEYDIFNPKEHIWERIAGKVPVEAKPQARYMQAALTIHDGYQFIESRLVPGQTFPSVQAMFDEIDTIRKRGDFELPNVHAYIDETINGMLVQTIVSMEELKENGSFMGNCTYSNYRNNYKSGEGVLFRIVHDGITYNTDLRQRGGGWYVRETQGNIKQNHAAVPHEVHEVNAILCRILEGQRPR